MKSFGELIRYARKSRKLTLRDLSKRTKIKTEFLSAIEAQEWEKLPDYPVLSGFVRSIAHSLEIDSIKLSAFLRRDYPPRTIRVSPKPDIADRVNWIPKLSKYIVGVVLVLIVAGYLAIQYIRFVSPPEVEIAFPPQNYVATENSLEVRGKTSDDATLKVNNQPIIVDANGSFSGNIGLSEETHELLFVAESRAGKKTEVKRQIEVNF